MQPEALASCAHDCGYCAHCCGPVCQSDMQRLPRPVPAGPFNLPSLTAGLHYSGQGDPRLIIRGATVDTLTVAARRRASTSSGSGGQ